MLTTAGLAAVAGCSSGDARTTTPFEQRFPMTTTTRTETPPETTITDVAWSDAEPTGVPAYHDDPNWRMVGHDTGHTFHNPHADGPDSDPTVRWTYDAGGSYWDSHQTYYPLIVDGTVYANVVRDGEKGGLVAIDGETGDAETVIETEQYLWKPTIVDGTVYSVLDGRIAAFDLESGEKLWQTENLFHWPSPPLCVDDVVVTGQQGYVVAFDANTGRKRWTAGQSGLQRYIGRPAIVDRTVVQHDIRSLVHLENGRERATLPASVAYPVVANGELYGISQNGLQSFDWKTLERRWSVPDTNSQLTMGAFSTVSGEHVCSVQSSEDGSGDSVVSRRRGDGTVRWSVSHERITPHQLPTDGTTVYPVADYFPTIAVDLQTGDRLWEFTPEGEKILGMGVALADDLLVVADGSGKIWALE